MGEFNQYVPPYGLVQSDCIMSPHRFLDFDRINNATIATNAVEVSKTNVPIPLLTLERLAILYVCPSTALNLS
jgi:hypothetical protein